MFISVVAASLVALLVLPANGGIEPVVNLPTTSPSSSALLETPGHVFAAEFQTEDIEPPTLEQVDESFSDLFWNEPLVSEKVVGGFSRFTILSEQEEAERQLSTRIVGGSYLGPGEDIGWQVALIRRGTSQYNGQFCGGSLIDYQWVLTAAHCVDDRLAGSFVVMAGDELLGSSVRFGIERNVERVWVHPDWNDSTKRNDIALIKLSSRFPATSAISLISLPNPSVGGTWPSNGSTGLISGWGSTGSIFPAFLKYGFVNMVGSPSSTTCGSYSSGVGGIASFDNDVMLCAGHPSFVVDTCQGDSGGPLAVQIEGEWFLAGVTSWGRGCALGGYPGIYTRTTTFTDWIARISNLPILFEFVRPPVPGVSGTAAVGEVLTAVPGDWGVAGTEFAYEWVRGSGRGAVVLGGELSQSYTVTDADFGQPLSVRVTGSKTGYSPKTVSSRPTARVAGSFEVVPDPSVSVTNPVVGDVVSVDPGDWGSGVRFRYQWLLDDEPIRRQTKSSLRVVDAFVGEALSVEVSGSKRGYATTTATSSSTSTVVGLIRATNRGGISLVRNVVEYGEILEVAPFDLNASDSAVVQYQWYRDGAVIESATSSSYSTVLEDIGAAITVDVYVTDAGYEDLLVGLAVDSVRGAAFPASPVPGVSGTAAVGEVLTAVPGDWEVAGTEFAYEWVRGSGRGAVVLGGESSQSYTVTDADFGQPLSVRVTGSKTGYSPKTVSSRTTAKVAGRPPDTESFVDNVTTVAGDQKLTIQWSGGKWADYAQGSEVTRVEVRASREEAADAAGSCIVSKRGGSLGTTCDITRLINYTVYTVQMRALNKTGWSGWHEVAVAEANRTPIPEGVPQISVSPIFSGTLEIGENLVFELESVTGSPPPSATLAWFRCETKPNFVPAQHGGCIEIRSETVDLTHRALGAHQVGVQDFGNYIAAQISVTNSVGNAQAYVTTQDKVSTQPLLDIERISWFPEFPVVGTHGLQAALGQVWTAYPALEGNSVTHQWLRCEQPIEEPLDTVPGHCVSLDNFWRGLFSSNPIVPEDAGKYVTVLVTATNEIGTTSFVIPRTVPVSSQIEMVTSPTLLGELIASLDAANLSVLSVNNGTWQGDPEPKIMIDWVTCARQYLDDNRQLVNRIEIDGGIVLDLPPACTVSGADQPSLPLSISFRNSFVTALVTAQNPGNTVKYLIPQSELPRYQPRIGVTPFSIELTGGTGAVGQNIRVTDPRWEARPDAEPDYSWHRCDSAHPRIFNSSSDFGSIPGDCEFIMSTGASREYVTQNADIGKNIMVVATAENEIGASSPGVRPATRGPIAGQLVLEGAAHVGSQVRATGHLNTLGTPLWGSSDTYRWFFCETDPRDSLAGLRENVNGPSVPADCDEVVGATGARLTLDQSSAGKFVLLGYSVTTNPDFGAPEGLVVEVASEQAVALADISPEPTVSITGNPQFGSSLQVTISGSTGLTTTIQWLRDGAPISGATGTTYTLQPIDVGNTISTDVTFTKAGFSPLVVTRERGNIAPANFGSTTTGISGAAGVGQELSANYSAWWPEPTTVSFQWFADSVAIPGATGGTYTLTLAQLGKRVSVQVTGGKEGYLTREVMSNQTAVVASEIPFDSTRAPYLHPTEVVRAYGVLESNLGSGSSNFGWSPQPTEWQYQWLRNGTPISGEIERGYEIREQDVGARISVQVTGLRPGYQSALVVSGQTAVVREPFEFSTPRTPTVSGFSGGVYSRLQANVQEWYCLGCVPAPEPTSFTYQWLRDGIPIVGANSRTYDTTLQDAERNVSVEVTGSRPNHRPATRRSDDVAVPELRLRYVYPTGSGSNLPSCGSFEFVSGEVLIPSHVPYEGQGTFGYTYAEVYRADFQRVGNGGRAINAYREVWTRSHWNVPWQLSYAGSWTPTVKLTCSYWG